MTDQELEALERRHTGSFTRVWGPGDTYEVCAGCDEQVWAGKLCTTRKLLGFIKHLQHPSLYDEEGKEIA